MTSVWRRPLAFAAVEDLEIVSGIGREEAGDVAEALGKGRSGKQGVFALTQVVVVEVDGQREHVDGQRIGERRFDIGVAGALVDAFEAVAAVAGAAAGLPGVLTGFAAYLCLGLG